jgi:hypothetical protein
LTWKRFLSSPFFLLALLCFLLPFFAVTCSGFGAGGLGDLPGADQAEEATTLTGLELVTGKAEEDLADPEELTGGGFPGGDLFPVPGPSPSIGVPPEQAADSGIDLGITQIWAIAAAAIALLGIFLALLAGRAGGVMALALGVAGAVVLFLLAGSLKGAVDDAVGEEAQGFIKVENKIGYWLALMGFMIAAVTGLIRLLLPERPSGAVAAGEPSGFGQPPGAPPPAAPPPATTPPESPPQ